MHLPETEMNYSYIEYYRKSYQYEHRPYKKEETMICIQYDEAMRDYFTGQITEIRHLVQFDQKPSDLKEAKWDVYKISFSFDVTRKY